MSRHEAVPKYLTQRVNRTIAQYLEGNLSAIEAGHQITGYIVEVELIRVTLERNEYLQDQICPDSSCGAPLGEEEHTGDCKARPLPPGSRVHGDLLLLDPEWVDHSAGICWVEPS